MCHVFGIFIASIYQRKLYDTDGIVGKEKGDDKIMLKRLWTSHKNIAALRQVSQISFGLNPVFWNNFWVWWAADMMPSYNLEKVLQLW